MDAQKMPQMRSDFKICVACHKEKPLSEFSKEKRTKSGTTAKCLSCLRVYNSAWRSKNEWWNRKYKREYAHYYRMKNYGVSREEFENRLKKNNGNCEICGTKLTFGDGGHAIDHDHKNGKFRGILCKSCNTGLGAFKDSKELLMRAARYIDENTEEEE